MSLFWGCLAARWSVSVGLLPTFRTLARVPCGMLRWCCAGAIGHISWQRPMVVAGMRWMERMGGPARGKWKRRKRGNKGRKPRGKKAKEVWVALKGRSGGSGMVSSPWVSINSCLGVGLCALCFSSYCLGIPVGTLPAPMLGSHHHPSHSDLQRQRGTSVE